MALTTDDDAPRRKPEVEQPRGSRGWLRVRSEAGTIAEPLQILAGNRLLALLVVAFGTLTIAEWGYVTALAVHVLQKNGPIAVGFVGFRLFFAAIGSIVTLPYVERHPGARTLSAIAAARAVIVGLSAGVAVIGLPTVLLLVLVAIDALISGAYRPAQSTMLPGLSRTPRELAASAAGISLVKTLAQAIGAMAGGFLLLTTTPAVVFAGAAVLLLTTALMTLRLASLRLPAPITMEVSKFKDRVRATVDTIREPHVAPLLTVSGLRTLVRGMWLAIAVIASLRLLHAGTGGVGLLMLAAGIGSLLAVPLTGRLTRQTRLGAPTAIALICCGAPMAVIAGVPRLGAAFACIVAWGVGMAVADMATLSLLYRVLDIPLLPRATTLIESSKLALEGFGGLLAPLLVSAFDIRTALLVAAVPLPLAVVISWRLLLRLDASASERSLTLALLHAVPSLEPLDMASLGLLATGVTTQHVPAETDVVTQGEPGNWFYVVKEGSAEVLLDGYPIGTVHPGGSFGERALLRDVPRTATVRSLEPMELLVLSRQAFLGSVTGQAVTRVGTQDPGRAVRPKDQEPGEVLGRLSVFSHLDAKSLRRLGERATRDEWPAGATLIRQGEAGDRFHVVLEGRAQVFVDGTQVAEVHPGDQLGEIALLHDVPRTATVVASTPVRMLTLQRRDFNEAVRSRVLEG